MIVACALSLQFCKIASEFVSGDGTSGAFIAEPIHRPKANYAAAATHTAITAKMLLTRGLVELCSIARLILAIVVLVPKLGAYATRSSPYVRPLYTLRIYLDDQIRKRTNIAKIAITDSTNAKIDNTKE